jgi:L-ascorbate oxidase
LIRKVLVALASLCLLTSCGVTSVPAANDAPPFPDPPFFASSHGVLDLLVIARASTVQLGQFQATDWVFEICQTAVAQGDNCPADSVTAAPYGGIRLQLSPGDHLRMRLINRLPPVPADAENAHGFDPMMNAMLAANPVNIHTHGLIVEPRKADRADPTWGDDIYVLGYPAGKLPSMVDSDETATDQPIQYDIYIPPNHPSGLFWFHPHVHGLSVNEISEGLSGLITIGSPSDYLDFSGSHFSAPTPHYIVLKDMQVLASGEVQDQEDAQFCAPTAASGEIRNGSCPGLDQSNNPDDSEGLNYSGGRWFFSVNGQVYPEIGVDGHSGQLWRFLNAGASRSYDLLLVDDQTQTPLTFQVVSLDGVSLAPPAGSTAAEIRRATADKVDAVPCASVSTNSSVQPVCASHLFMAPSARAEIWIAPQQSPPSGHATLLTRMVNTGIGGDDWPESRLAHFTFSGGAPSSLAVAARAHTAGTLRVKQVSRSLLSSKGLLGEPVQASFAGFASPLTLRDAARIAAGKNPSGGFPSQSGASAVGPLSAAQVREIEARMAELSKPVPSIASAGCTALPPGHRRRIFFGNPAWDSSLFGLGYEEVDANDVPVPGTFEYIAPFDPNKVNVCLPLGPGNSPVTEVWELVNVAPEMHNFHMHQTKFRVLTDNAPPGDGGVLMDNVPLPNGGGNCDGSVALWRLGTCKVPIVRVAIPFAEAGDFVYHCHIGEHQDGGMMAHIRVIANP